MELLSTDYKTIDDVRYLINKQASISKYIEVSTEDIYVVNANRLKLKGYGYIEITDWAMYQLCSKLGIPYSYIKKLNSKHLTLLQTIFTEHIKFTPRTLLMRIYEDTVIAVLSTKYTIIDNLTVLNDLDNINIFDTMQIKTHLITPQRLHLRLVNNNPVIEDVYPGIEIENSEVGKYTFSIHFILYKQICFNGLKVPFKETLVYKQKHIHTKAIEINKDIIANNLKQIDVYADKAKAIIESNSKIKLNSEQVDKIISDLVNQKLLPKSYVTSDDFDTKFILLRYGFTKWGVVNMITEISQDFTLDKRLEIENYAGRLLIQ